MNRIAFIVDGFNLYHSVRSASRDLGLSGVGTRWLNIRSLCDSYLYLIGKDAKTVGVYYFSALATHLQAVSPGVVMRHKSYIACLEDLGISVELARFKEKTIWCNSCKGEIRRHEEKETDVAIGVKLLELLLTDACDTCLIVSGDTDIVPAVKTAQRMCPDKQVGFLLPYKRHNSELAALTSLHFKIKKETYTKHQLSDPFLLRNGSIIAKPSSW